MADITKSKLPLMTAIGFLGVAIGGAVAWGKNVAEHEADRARITRVEAKQEQADSEHVEQRLRTQRVEDAQNALIDMVKEIRSDVKDLKRSGR